jgi:Ser/Thr protein kinase RdoA (MazF antagonist)
MKLDFLGETRNHHFNETDAQQIAERIYGLRAQVHTLPGEYDANFHLATESGAHFVLKVMRVGCERALVELQCAALTHLAAHAPALMLPRVCPTLAGEWMAATESVAGRHLVWMLAYVQGDVLAQANPRTSEMLFSLGRLLGEVDAALSSFAHPAAQRAMKWDLARAGWVKDYAQIIADESRRTMIEHWLQRYETEVVPQLAGLRRGVIHNDANDYNVIVSPARTQPRVALSVIDFGDMLHTCVVFELAIAAAYALLDQADLLASSAQVIAGYHQVHPLTEAEIALLYELIGARLMVSVVNSAQRKLQDPDDAYITISEGPAWEALEKLTRIPPRLAHYVFRHACGLPPVPHSDRVVHWLRRQNCAAVLEEDLRAAPSLVFDLSVGSLLLGADPAAFESEAMTETICREMKRVGATVGIGRYDEARSMYTTPAFAPDASVHPTAEHRTIHLGMDLYFEHRRTGFVRDTAEFSRATVAIKNAPLTILSRFQTGVDVAVDHENIQPAVVVVIHEAHAPAEKVCVLAQARLRCAF